MASHPSSFPDVRLIIPPPPTHQTRSSERSPGIASLPSWKQEIRSVSSISRKLKGTAAQTSGRGDQPRPPPSSHGDGWSLQINSSSRTSLCQSQMLGSSSLTPRSLSSLSAYQSSSPLCLLVSLKSFIMQPLLSQFQMKELQRKP